MAAVLSLSKGRACNSHLLCICRKVAAYVMCLNSFVRFRWVKSEHNRADGPSRWYMTDEDRQTEARLK
eukprot:5648733-Karenia_brevis.AAC.1